MSSTGGDSGQRKQSNKIDKELEEDSKKLRKECKILLLGTSPPVPPLRGSPIALPRVTDHWCFDDA